MEPKASIVKIYSNSKPAERVDIILMNYTNFLGIVDAHTEGLVHVISSEKSYNRKSKQGDLGIRIQVSGTSNPTADMAIENVMLREDIKKCNFSEDLLKDLDKNEEAKFKRDMLTLPDNIKPEMIGEKRYVRMAEGAKRYSVGLNTFRNMAAEAHAIIHVRRIVLIDTKMIDEYLEAFREE